MSRKLAIVIAVVVLFVLGGTGIIFYGVKIKKGALIEQRILQADKYEAFLSESYDIIKNNYWEKLTEEQLGKIWILADEQISGQSQPELKNINKDAVIKVTNETINNYDKDDKKKQFCQTVVDAVLANLQPNGRSRLYTLKEEKALSDAVLNKTTENKYQTLGVDKTASASTIQEAYQKESEKYNSTKNTDPEAKQKYEAVQKAYQTLSDPVAKNNYDIAGVEPTMEYRLINSSIYYIHMTKFSPTSYDELNRVMSKVADKADNLNTLIFDLRDNIGGSIDIMPYFLGPFIGYDQYAYQFLHQGERIDFKTKTSWMSNMVRYKKVVVLINQNSQSTAELMASVLKRYNVGVLVGVPTKGWGTVEKVFPINNQLDPNEKNSIFLVHSLTLREDGQPIEGRGVEPDVDVRNTDWKYQLNDYFSNQEVVSAVEELIKR